VKNANGQGIHDILIDIMDKFLSYDLQSKGGVEAAIQDIESRLAIASFKDPEPIIIERVF
jgi:hypothetical protein